MHKERLFTGDSGRTGLICRICDRKYVLYLRYQTYAREIGIKDQLILSNQTLLDEVGKEIIESIEEFKTAYTKYQDLISNLTSDHQDRTVSLASETPELRTTEKHRSVMESLRMKIDEA